MGQRAKPSITVAGGGQQQCRLSQKSNNENGQFIYVFINEVSGETYTIMKSDGQWVLVNGAHDENYIHELGEFIDQCQ